jgi:hypothetical protein
MINIIYLFFQPLFLILSYLFIGDISDVWMCVFVGCNVSFFYLLLARHQMLNSPTYINALVVYLLVQFVYVGVSSFYYALLTAYGYTYFRFSAIYFNNTDLIKGALLVIFADYFMFLSYFLIDDLKKRKEKNLELQNNISINQHFLTQVVSLVPFLYGGVWLLRLLPTEYIRMFGSFIVGIKLNGGNIIQMFLLASLVFNINKLKKTTYVMVLVIFCCDLLYCSTTTSKTRVIMLFLPFIFIFLCYTKGKIKMLFRPRIFIPAICIAYFLIMIVFPVNQHLRKMRPYATINISDVGYIAYDRMCESLPWTDVFYEANHLPRSGFWRFFARSSAIAPNAIAIILKESDPDMHINFIETGLLMLIPRILWLDKPLNMSGSEASEIISGESGNSLGFGLPGSLMLSGGFAAIIIVMLFAGFVMNIGWVYIQRDIFYNPISMLCAFNLILGSMRLPGVHDGGINHFIKFLILYIPLCYFSRLYFQSRKTDQLIHIGNTQSIESDEEVQ